MASDPKGPFSTVRPDLDFPRDEAAILAFWKQNRIFEKSLSSETRSTGPSKGTFVFYEGPPTANGMPHNGHVLTRAVKDVFPRFKTMQGYDVPRKAGWDTHGLPVEVEVEKELKIHGKADIQKYGVEPFTHRCIESVFRYTEAWEKLTDKIGFWVDLEDAYVTFHKSYVESVWWALSELFKKGLLYQGHKVVWWWAQGGTALSSAEVGLGYKTVDDPSVYVSFPLVDEPNAALLVWTTTPWTLPSNMYAAVHPDFSYAYVSGFGDKLLVVAKDLVPAIAKKLGVELTVEREVKGSELAGKKYTPPFDIYAADGAAHAETFSVIPANFVVMDASGIVHIAPAFGEDDNAAHRKLLEKNRELPLFCAIGPDGKFTEVLPRYQGRWVKDCDKELIAELKERGLMVFAETYRHEYPFCWRSDADPLIQFARPAWYIRTTQEISRAIDNNQQIQWLPDHIKGGRFGDFLRNNVDWALSRERFWGTPLNIWVNDVTGKLAAPASVEEILAKNPEAFLAFEQARAKDPSLSPHLMVHKPWVDNVTFTEPGEEGVYRRVPDVIDCWFDSGCMPFAQWGYPHKEGSKAQFERAFPANFISEAIDQTRGWFYSLLMISTLVFDKAPLPHPYQTCVVLGHVCDKEGKKESKSKGNYTPPDIILERVRMDFAAFDAAGKGLTLAKGEAVIAREDYEGLDLTGESASVLVYLKEGEALKLKLRPATNKEKLPRRVVGLHAEDIASLGVTPSPTALETKPSDVPFLPLGQRVLVEDPSASAPGADAFRWFFYAASPSWTNTRHSLTNVRLEQKEFLVKLRNVYSFFTIYANIDGFDPARENPNATVANLVSGAPQYRAVAERSELDRWMMSELCATVEKVTAALEGYLLYDAARALVDLAEGVSNWFVRRSRARFWSKGRFFDVTEAASQDKADAYFTLYEVLVTLSGLMAPFTPFFAEELWQNLVRGPFGARMPESVHLASFPKAVTEWALPELSRDMFAVRELVSLGREVRTTVKMRVRQPLSRADVVVGDPQLSQRLRHFTGLIAEELNVHEVRVLAPGEEAGFVKYTLKPNFKTLGPRLGKKVQACKAALAKADAGALRTELSKNGSVSLEVEGEPLALGPEEIEVAVDAAEGYAAAGNKVGVLVLALELTDALREEGLAREIVARLQQTRKDVGLSFTDKAIVRLDGDAAVISVAEKQQELLCREAMIASLTIGAAPEGAQAKEYAIDGAVLRVWLEAEKA